MKNKRRIKFTEQEFVRKFRSELEKTHLIKDCFFSINYNWIAFKIYKTVFSKLFFLDKSPFLFQSDK